jgi:hypothetical protein
MPRHGHSRADARNLALHQAALLKLKQRPELQARVLELLDRWLGQEELQSARRSLETWREMLTSWSLAAVQEQVLDEERGQVLRQCSPLAPVLTPRERWAILKTVNERLEREERGSAR